MFTQLSRLVAAVAVACGALLTMSGPACACSCVPNPDMSERVAKAEAVFVGRVVDTDRAGQTKTLTFEVDQVYKGQVAKRQEILTHESGASCGLEIEGPGPFVVFGSTGDHGLGLTPAKGQYTAILCGGADPVTPAGVEELGAGKAPAAAPEVKPAAEVEAISPRRVTDDESTGVPVWAWFAGAAVLLAAAGGGLFWWRRSRA